MLDFTPVRSKQMTMAQLAEGLTPDDLRRLTNEMVDRMLAMIEGCDDADVVFTPLDPTAHDGAAATEAEVNMSWTLGHVIVHTTASAEEAAFLAAELARGVKWHGRSRSEVSWQTVTTLQQCRDRLEDSRRMRLALLDAWPRAAALDNTYQPFEGSEPVNCVNRFLRGISHDDSHLGQIAEIVRQAKAVKQ